MLASALSSRSGTVRTYCGPNANSGGSMFPRVSGMSTRTALALTAVATLVLGAFLWSPGADPTEPTDGPPAQPEPVEMGGDGRPLAPDPGRPQRPGPPTPNLGDVDPRLAGLPFDPALVPGKPGVLPPDGLPVPPPPDLDADPDRHRSPTRNEPPPVVPPHVKDRPPGVPPTPQGAGERAHEVYTGEPDTFGDPVDADAVRAAMQADLEAALVRASACFESGRVPPMTFTVEEDRHDDGSRTGFVGLVDPGDDGEFSEELADCVMDLLEELVLAAPPGARRTQVSTGQAG